MTSQYCIKVEHVRTRLLSSSRAKFQQFWSEFFFLQVLFSSFLTFYKSHIQLLFLTGRVFHGIFSSRLKVFLIFFVWNLQTVLPLKPFFFERLFIFVLLFVIMGLCFAPARGGSASVTEQVKTSQFYIKVEHVRTWLLSPSLAKFLQFESEFFFQVCFNLFLPAYMVHVQFLPLKSCVSFVFFSPCEDWNFGFFWSEIFKRLLDETHVFGRSFYLCICF